MGESSKTRPPPKKKNLDIRPLNSVKKKFLTFGSCFFILSRLTNTKEKFGGWRGVGGGGWRGFGRRWSVSNFPHFLHFESRNAISNFRWWLSIVTVKSSNQFIVMYHPEPLLPTEAHYLSHDYKWRRKKREKRKKRGKGSWNKQNLRRPSNGRTPAETAGRVAIEGDSFWEASLLWSSLHNGPAPAYLSCPAN
jgi:hypothetical protein